MRHVRSLNWNVTQTTPPSRNPPGMSGPGEGGRGNTQALVTITTIAVTTSFTPVADGRRREEPPYPAGPLPVCARSPINKLRPSGSGPRLCRTREGRWFPKCTETGRVRWLRAKGPSSATHPVRCPAESARRQSRAVTRPAGSPARPAGSSHCRRGTRARGSSACPPALRPSGHQGVRACGAAGAAPQGQRRSILHAPPSRTYRSRSCSRFSCPCQNSSASGTTRSPPHSGGTGTCSPSG